MVSEKRVQGDPGWLKFHRRACGSKRMTRLWQLGQRAMVEPRTIESIIKGREPGKDMRWLIERYQRNYGKRLKAETVQNIYRNELTYRANQVPAVISPLLRKNLDALGNALAIPKEKP